MNLAGVVWSEFASAALPLYKDTERWSPEINEKLRVEKACKYADLMLTEFYKRFPDAQGSQTR